METTTQPLDKTEFDAYTDLSKEATSVEDLATLREMAEQDAGTGVESHMIEVKDDNGEVQTIHVTDIGKNALKHSTEPLMAVHSEDWRTEEK